MPSNASNILVLNSLLKRSPGPDKISLSLPLQFVVQSMCVRLPIPYGKKIKDWDMAPFQVIMKYISTFKGYSEDDKNLIGIRKRAPTSQSVPKLKKQSILELNTNKMILGSSSIGDGGICNMPKRLEYVYPSDNCDPYMIITSMTSNFLQFCTLVSLM